MTKPNELTLAIERIERFADAKEAQGREHPVQVEREYHQELAAALRLVIEAAREVVTVNPETPRAKHLKRLKELRRSHAKWATWPRPEQLQQQSAGCAESLQWAIDELSALSLASPFTEEEWAEIKELVDSAVAGMVRGVAQMGGPEKAYPLARLLRSIEAKLDAMLAQSSPANRALDGVDAPADNSRLHRP